MSEDPCAWRLKPTADIRVDAVIPVYNEAHVLEHSIRRVHDFFAAQIPYRWRIVIAENGSRDGTAEIAGRLRDTMSNVGVVEVEQPGRGRALRTAWTQSDADVVSYTDVDLSTELEAFPRMFASLIEGGYDVAARVAAAGRIQNDARPQAHGDLQRLQLYPEDRTRGGLQRRPDRFQRLDPTGGPGRATPW